MNSEWSKKWKKVLIWLSGYLSFVAYAIVGGYTIVKSEDEDLKKTAKIALVVTLIFTALTAFFAIFGYCGSFSSSYYGSGAQKFCSICQTIISIAKIIVFAVFIIMALCEKTDKVEIKDAPKEETTDKE